uniref:Uncharacterized protein n=1 Tax=Anguilla anguilla TaxID=7936 RepID=A0A0E9VKW0_ANGAN
MVTGDETLTLILLEGLIFNMI